LIVALLLLWILDYLGMLEVAGAVLELIGAVIAGVVSLITYLIRRLTGFSKPQP
jgi:hypothetical protein